jgi:hypothetical protein
VEGRIHHGKPPVGMVIVLMADVQQIRVLEVHGMHSDYANYRMKVKARDETGVEFASGFTYASSIAMQKG